MARSSGELQRVFGKLSRGETEEERAATSDRIFVRSQVQIAEDSASAKGHRLGAQEALRLFGYKILASVAEDGSAALISSPDEPAATLKERRETLGLSVAQVAKKAGVSEALVAKAEQSGTVTPIRELERLAQVLALNEQALGRERGARGDKDLGVRLREFSEFKDTRKFSPSDVLALTEAAWVIRTQSDLSRLVDKDFPLRELRFAPDANYAFPTYERGYELAEKTRKLLNIGQDEPISSMKSLIEERLHVPVVQQALASKFAGATLADGADRGIVVNEAGQNANVWVRRMTMAHELGHLLWDPDQRLNKLKVDKYDDVTSDVKDPVEIRANAFAISFLAPPAAVRRIVDRKESLVAAVSEVMITFGMSGTAAKYHVQNACNRNTRDISVSQLPSASDDWTGRENLTLDWFPLKNTPISRRGRFALLAAQCLEAGLISLDTASMYLRSQPEELKSNVDSIIAAFQ